jgi:hypothetical protein
MNPLSSSITRTDQLGNSECIPSFSVSPQKSLTHQQSAQGFQDLMRTFKPDGL